MDRPTHRLWGLLPAALVGGLLAALALAGPAGAAATVPLAGTAPPGAIGTVAAIAGTSMEVQNQQTGQVTVDWTSTTTFTQDATVPASSVVVADCVMVTGSTSKGKITAQAVSISQPSSSGSCPGAGPPKGAGPSGAGGTAPVRISGSGPGNAQAVAPPGGTSAPAPRSLGIASGKVLSVSGSRLVLSGFSSTAVQKTIDHKKSDRGAAKTVAGKGRSGKRPVSGKPQVVSVALSSKTAYTETQPAAASDLAAGDCVAANGPSASNGSITAKAVQITATGGKSCTAGPGLRVSGGNVPGGVNSEQISG